MAERSLSEIDYYVDSLGLLPHPEGGFYKETYRSELVLAGDEIVAHFNAERIASTGIYFLLTSENHSNFHRIKSDEMWHFYAGDPLEVYGIHPDGRLEVWLIGDPLKTKGAQFQVVVPAGIWFGSSVVGGGDFSLCGCTVSPGFDFLDFELAKRSELLLNFPQHAEIITKLTLS